MNLDVGQRARLTDATGLVDGPGLDTHLAALRVDDTRAVRSNETRLGLALERVHDLSGTQPRIQIAARKMMMTAHLDLVQLGNTFRDTHDETNLILNGLDDGVGGGRWWDVEDGCVGLDLPDSLRPCERAKATW